MAGHYFYDPRPFYGQNGSNGLMPLDELFYGRYEPVPYWMDQRMGPVSAFDDYYPGHKQMAMGRPPPQLMQYAYKRPESRDDIGVDLYRRSPYNFHGVGAPMGYGGQPPPPPRQSQDDTWVPYAQHPGTTMTRTSNTTNDHYMDAPMGYIPSTNLNTTRGMEMPMMNTKGNNNNNTMTSMGNHGSKQMNSSSTQFGNKSSNGLGNSNNGHGNSNNGYGNSNNGHGNSNNGFGNSNNGHGNGNNGFGNSNNGHGNGNNGFGNSNNGHGNGNNGYGNSNSGHGNGNSGYGNSNSGHGNSNSGYGNGNSGYGNSNSGYGNGSKAMNSKQGGSTKGRYVDSSSDDSDDEYGTGNNNGVKWATKGSVKHGNGHQNFTQKSGLKGNNNNYGYDSMHLMSSKSKSSGHGGRKSGGSHGHSTQSKLSKLFGFGDSSSSDSDDDGYRHTKKSSSKGMSNNYGNHGSHGSQGSFLSHGHQQQSKQMQYGSSQSRGVELKVPICCDNCERKVRECLEYMAGVENVLCDQWNRKVIVYGNVKPENVLKRVRKVKKASELWQQGKQNQQLRVY